METGQDRKRNDCRVVVGPDEAAAARAAWPDLPIVALVEASDPAQAVLARTAGADVVVPTADLAAGWRADTPGLALAVTAAASLAERRAVVRHSSRDSTHDLGQALSAINLAAELAVGEDDRSERLLDQIRTQTRDAGIHAWRAGRPGRSPELALVPVDLSALLHRIAIAEPDVAVYDSSGVALVLGDTTHLQQLLEGLIQHGRRTATNQRIDVSTAEAGRVDIVIGGTGKPRSPQPEQDVEFGLMAVAELAGDLGGTLQLEPSGAVLSKKPEQKGAGIQVGDQVAIRLSLPLVPDDSHFGRQVAVPPDGMAIQTDILEGVLRHAPLSESLEAIVAAIEQQLPGSKCSILLLNDQACLHHGAGASLPETYRTEIDGLAIGYGQGSCGTAAFLGRPVIATNVETDRHWENFKDVALDHDLRSCWSTPILAADGGAVLGTFAVYRANVWEPDDAATRLVSRFTYLAAVAIGHHRLFNAVAESESRFRGAFEGATAGMALVGLDGSFLKVNPALRTMLGTDAVGLFGANVLDLVAPAHRNEISDSWNQLLSGRYGSGEPEHDPIEVPIVDHAGDEPLWVSLRSSLVRTDGDSQQYLYIEIRDISASRRHAVERRAREAAEAANRAKTDFLALVSHELRTPLNAILGFAQVMGLVELDASQRADSVDNILKAGHHLLDLINELLDLSLIESGQLSTSIEVVDAEAVVDDALQILQPLADSRNITLGRGPSGDLADAITPALRSDCLTKADLTGCAPIETGPMLRADRQCLRQVLINLVGNAVKFTPAGGSVGVGIEPGPAGDGSDHDPVRIRVFDSGPGIPAEAIDNVFQPFQRLTSVDRSEAEGTGLGLSVSARLVEEMNGRIGVESSPGAGSCFWVDLPGVVAQPGAVTNPPATVGPDRPTGTLDGETTGVVLHVEDDPASVSLVSAALSLRPGLELLAAETATEGFTMARGNRPDVILLDIGLPDDSGWNLLTSLRQCSDTASIPVVVLTAGPARVPDGTEDPELVMVKPLDIGRCLQALDELLAAGHQPD